MRRDMFKVIVERGRRGGHGARKRRAPRDIEELPPRGHGKAAALSGDRKDLNETLAPLRRFIEGCEGRRWNDVYSELRENIKPGNTVQEHVLTHVDQFISRHVQEVEPSQECPCGLREKTGRFYSFFGLRPGDLYVDSRDGIVKRARVKFKGYDGRSRSERFRDEYEASNKLLEPRLFAKKINGVWYGFILEPYVIEQRMERVELPEGGFKSKRTVLFAFNGETERLERVLEQVVGRTYHASDSGALDSLAKRYYGGRALIARQPKVQLSSAQLKAYSLRNDA